MECYLYSERLSFSIKFYTLFNLLLTVRFFYPNAHKSIRFLYYFCLCKSFKELFLLCLPRSVSRLAGAKVLLFSEPPKLFETFFAFYAEKSSTLDKNQGAKPPTPYYIIYREGKIKGRGKEVKGGGIRRIFIRIRRFFLAIRKISCNFATENKNKLNKE